MKRNIKKIKVETHSQAWYDFRDNGYGASETPAVVSADAPDLAEFLYTSPVQIHLLKIGEPVTRFSGNPASEAGHFYEPIIAHLYKCYNKKKPDLMDMYDNARSKHPKVYNKVARESAYVVNPKYPWLFVSPDYFGKPETFGIECKDTNDMEANRYPNKVSPSFVVQVQTQLLVTEWEYIDIVMKLDRGKLEVITVEPDKEVMDFIVEATHKYWVNVQKARAIKGEYNIPSYYNVDPDLFDDQQKEAVYLLQQLEPELSGTEAEFKFIKENIKPREEIVMREGSQDEWEWLMAYYATNKEIKNLESAKKASLSKVLASLKGSNKIFFGDEKENRYFSYIHNEKGVARAYLSPKLFE